MSHYFVVLDDGATIFEGVMTDEHLRRIEQSETSEFKVVTYCSLERLKKLVSLVESGNNDMYLENDDTLSWI